MMTGESLKYLLAVLNSVGAKWYFQQIATTSGMGTNRWKKYKIEQLPVPVPTTSDGQAITALVDLVLSQKKVNPSATTLALEAEIDLMVYHLYTLTHAEVLLIDPQFALSEAAYVAAGKIISV